MNYPYGSFGALDVALSQHSKWPLQFKLLVIIVLSGLHTYSSTATPTEIPAKVNATKFVPPDNTTLKMAAASDIAPKIMGR